MAACTKFFTTIIFVFISFIYCLGQNVNITTQAEMDAFDPSTTEISGTLSINGVPNNDPVINLNNLSNLTSVGALSIKDNIALTNLDGLSNLISIDGLLSIRDNVVLTNLDDLSSLSSVSGSLSIRDNIVLINLNGLSNLSSIGGGLSIRDNPIPTNLDGLSSLTSVGGILRIEDNIALMNIDGLSSLTFAGGGLYIRDNSTLTNLDGLSGLSPSIESVTIYENIALTNVDGLSNITSCDDLNISFNTNLTNVDGLSNITSCGDLLISYNTNLTNLDGLSSLNSVLEYYNIIHNTNLTNLDGLSNLTFVGKNFQIEHNDNLMNVDGLSSLASVGENLLIRFGNNALTNLDGLSNLISVDGDLTIYDNASLVNCCGIQNLLNTPGAISGNVTISNNPSECSSEEEVIDDECDSCSLIIEDIIIGDCNNNETNTDPSDDIYEVNINVSTLSAGTTGTYSINDGTNNYGVFTYGMNETITLPADGNIYTLIFTDSDDLTCTNQAEVSQEPCSITSTIELNGKSLDYSIFPNPTKENFQIEITGNTAPLDIQIYNSIGQKILEMAMVENIAINTSLWVKGIYSIAIYDKNGKILGIEKVLKTE